MHTKITTIIFLLTIWTLTSTVIAHPGHGHNQATFSIIHYLTEPIHALIGIAGLTIVGVGIYSFKHRNKLAHKSK